LRSKSKTAQINELLLKILRHYLCSYSGNKWIGG